MAFQLSVTFMWRGVAGVPAWKLNALWAGFRYCFIMRASGDMMGCRGMLSLIGLDSFYERQQNDCACCLITVQLFQQLLPDPELPVLSCSSV